MRRHGASKLEPLWNLSARYKITACEHFDPQADEQWSCSGPSPCITLTTLPAHPCVWLAHWADHPTNRNRLSAWHGITPFHNTMQFNPQNPCSCLATSSLTVKHYNSCCTPSYSCSWFLHLGLEMHLDCKYLAQTNIKVVGGSFWALSVRFLLGGRLVRCGGTSWQGKAVTRESNDSQFCLFGVAQSMSSRAAGIALYTNSHTCGRIPGV